MKVMIQHSSKIFDAENVRFIFWQACYKGNLKVVNLFLNHPQKQKIFTENDYDGTGMK